MCIWTVLPGDISRQPGQASGLRALYCPGAMTGGLLSWWASSVPGALLHNSLIISQGSWAKVDVKLDSPPVLLNQPPSAHLFVFFICLSGPLIWTLGSPSKFCHASGSDKTWLGPEVTLLVLVSACFGDEMHAAATHLSSGLGYIGLFWELQITLKICDKNEKFCTKTLKFQGCEVVH